MIEGICAAIGNTPLVRMTRLFDALPFRLYAKLESLNPGGSIKDRPAFIILKHAIDAGVIHPEAVIIESSSGNMGIGLAQACSYFGLHFICVVDPKTTQQNIRLLKVYGAEINLVEQPDATTGEFLQARIDRVQHLLQTTPKSFWPDQYSNIYNPIAHHQTMGEIVRALNGQIDYLFCAVSTCGTLRGCTEFIREHNLSTKVIAVDAIGSVIFGGQSNKRLIPGHGAAVRPHLFQDELASECVHVSDLDCIIGCRRLVRQEAILAGGSSGAVVAAINRVRNRIPDGATCVAILPDRGERYLDTIYSDAWVAQHFGEQADMESNYMEAKPCPMATF